MHGCPTTALYLMETQVESANWAAHCRLELSNWKEANNLATKLENMAQEGVLNDAEIFGLTDNSVFEGTFYKGHSHSQTLKDAILQIQILKRKTGCIIHIIHLAGTRMKLAGIDWLSRGAGWKG